MTTSAPRSTRRLLAIGAVSACALLGGALLLLPAWLQPSLRGRVEAALETAFSAGSGEKVEAQVDSVELSLFPLEVTAQGVALKDESGQPLLSAQALRIRPSLRSLVSGQLDLHSTQLAGVRLELRVRDGRIVNLPLFSDTGSLPFRSLSLEGGQLAIDAEPAGRAELRGVRLSLSSAAGRSPALNLSAAHCTLRGAAGEVELGALSAQGTLGSSPQLAGTASGDNLEFAFGWDPRALSFSIERGLPTPGSSLSFAGVLAAGAAPRFELSFERAALRELLAYADPRPGPSPLPLEAVVSGRFRLEGGAQPGEQGTLRGPLSLERFEVVGGSPGQPWLRTTLTLAAQAEWHDGSLALEELSLVAGSSQLRGRARIDRAQGVSLQLAGDAVELSELGLLPEHSLAGRGRLALSFEDGSGDDSDAGAPALRGEFALSNARLGALSVQRASGRYRRQASSDELVFEELELTQGQGRVTSRSLVLQDDAGTLNARGTLVLRRVALRELRQAAPMLPLPESLEARLGGEVVAQLAGGSGQGAPRLALEGRLSLTQASWSGVALGKGELTGRYQAPLHAGGLAEATLQLERLSLSRGKRRLSLEGELERNGALSFELEAKAVPLSAWPVVSRSLPGLAATMDVKGRIAGSRVAPRAELAIGMRELAYDGRALGAARLQVWLDEPGAEAARATCPALARHLASAPLPRAASSAWFVCGKGLGGGLEVALALGRTRSLPVRGYLRGRRLDLMARLAPRSLPALRNAASFELTLDGGGLRQPASLAGQLHVNALWFEAGGQRVAARTPFRAPIEGGALALPAVVFEGGGAELTLSGGVSAPEGLQLQARGQAPAALLARLSPWVERGFGTLVLRASLSGAFSTPSLQAELSPRDVVIALSDGSRLHGLNGRLVATPSGLAVERLRGKLGGGELELDGTVSLHGSSPVGHDLQLSARDVALEPWQRVEVTLDADARLRSQGEGELPQLSGVVRLERALFARHLELPEALIALNRVDRERRAAYRPERDRVALDLAIEHAESLRVRNNFLDAELAVAGESGLRVVGTDQRFSLLGALSVRRGRVSFRGDQFDVTRGKIEFRDPERIDPRFDLRAVAQLRHDRSTSVIFTASGSRDAFELDLSCEGASASEGVAPFECAYEGERFACDSFEDLVQLWLCKPGGTLGQRR